MSGGELIFALRLIAPGVAGLLLGRWSLLIAIAAIWIGIAVFLKVNNGWHGAGWGELGIEMNILWALLTFLAAGIGVGARKAVWRFSERSPA